MYSILFIVLILWSTSSSLPISDSVSDSGLSPEFIQEENNTLSQLDREAGKIGNGIFRHAWVFSAIDLKQSMFNLLNIYRRTGILNEGEIRILICYGYSYPKFHEELNTNLRETCGRRYPVVTKVMKEALTKLRKYQSGIPITFYRAEPISMFASYQDLFNNSFDGMLEQFTSTSTRLEIAQGLRDKDPENLMITKFEDPHLGAYIAEFSNFNGRAEVLLPVSGFYSVKTATKDCNNNYNVVLTNTLLPWSNPAGINPHLLLHVTDWYIKCLINRKQSSELPLSA